MAPRRHRLRVLVPALLCLLAGTARAGETRRFALLVGDDDGGPGTEHLYYAHDDARRIRDILVRLGGVRAGRRHPAPRRQPRALPRRPEADRPAHRRRPGEGRADHPGGLLLGARGERGPAPRGHRPEALRPQGPARGLPGGRAHRHPRLVPLRAHRPDQGGAAGPGVPGGRRPGERRQGSGASHLLERQRGQPGVRPHRRQLLHLQPRQRAARQRRPLRGRAGDPLGGLRLRLRPHRRRHRRHRGRPPAPDLRLRPRRQRGRGPHRRGEPAGGPAAARLGAGGDVLPGPRRRAHRRRGGQARRGRPAHRPRPRGLPDQAPARRTTCASATSTSPSGGW